MLVMPILNTSRNGNTKIYNVKVSLKTATKVKESTSLKGFGESDIIINGSSFNSSVYNVKNKEPNVLVNFLRNNNYRANKKDFLITTRENSNSSLYDLYNVEMPPKKITAGLDNLYGSILLDMQKEIPNIKHGRYLDLRKLGVDFHLSDDRLEKINFIVKNVEDKKKWEYLFTANGVNDLVSTLDFMNLFDFSIINEATIKEEDLKNMISTFNHVHSKDSKNLSNYYETAKRNKEIYGKLTYLNQLIYDKPINLIHKPDKLKILVKKNEQTGS